MCMHVFVYVSVYVCMYSCMYICICVHLSSLLLQLLFDTFQCHDPHQAVFPVPQLALNHSSSAQTFVLFISAQLISYSCNYKNFII